MKAFLLTAGLGIRLRPLTNEVPKCLLPICGKPLLEIWLDLLAEHGISEVLVNMHWRHEKVFNFLEGEKVRREEVGKVGRKDERRTSNIEHRTSNGKTKEVEEDGKRWPGVRLFYEEELLGSAGTLLANRDWVADGRPFFILYGDNLTNVNLGKMRAFHEGHDLPFTLGVFRAERPESCGVAEIDEKGVVVGFEEKPEHPKSDLAAAGTYIADNRIFDVFPEDVEGMRPLDLGFHVIPRLVGRMKAYFIEEFLMDIGTADSYERAQECWRELVS